MVGGREGEPYVICASPLALASERPREPSLPPGSCRWAAASASEKNQTRAASSLFHSNTPSATHHTQLTPASFRLSLCGPFCKSRHSPHSYTNHVSPTDVRSLPNKHHTQPHPANITTTNMADNLNMNGLSLNESAHAPRPGGQQNGFGGERSAYIPPHMRNRGPPPSGGPGGPAGPGDFGGPPPGPGPMGNGMNGSAWAPPQQK